MNCPAGGKRGWPGPRPGAPRRPRKPPGRAAQVCRPYGISGGCLYFVGAGPRPARQYTHRERLLGKPRRKSGTAPAAIFANPGPSGPEGIAESHSDFARRKFRLTLQVRVPRNGGPGVRRIWTRSVHPEPSPGDPLGTFPSGGLSSEVQRFVKKEFKRRFPAQAFAGATI